MRNSSTSVTFTVGVAANAPGAGIPAGTVTLYNGATRLASEHTQFVIADLPGEEFAATSDQGQLRAIDAQAVDRIDLLTVMEHELGHIAGLADLSASLSDIMSATLATGTRRTIAEADVDSILAQSLMS